LNPKSTVNMCVSERTGGDRRVFREPLEKRSTKRRSLGAAGDPANCPEAPGVGKEVRPRTQAEPDISKCRMWEEVN
jgi:hypothetical protein